ncbi:MAG: response regulator [Planctomycetota bacterium]
MSHPESPAQAKSTFMINLPPGFVGPNEQERLAALHKYGILDTGSDEFFDRITRITARTLNLPIAVISLVDRDRIWFKSAFGLEATEIPREPAFCSNVVLQDDVYEIPNTTLDSNSRKSELVTGVLGVRYYAAAPLIDPDGFRLGTLCVLSDKPHRLSDEDREFLKELADVAMDEILLVHRSQELLAEKEQRRRMESAAIQQEKIRALGVMVGGVAHDLNNLLVPIISNSQMLELDASDDRQLDLCKAITSAGLRGSELCSTLLAFAGERNPQFSDCQLKPLVETAIYEIGLAKPKARIEVALADDVYVHADTTQITQVIINLLMNAIEASPEDEKVRLESEIQKLDELFIQSLTNQHEAQPGKYLKVLISDNGCGLPDEIRDRILEPFFSTKEEGTGMGLPFSIGLLAGHAAPVNIDSLEGKGTQVSFWLPLAAQESKSSKSVSTLEKSPEAINLLVVEDDNNVRTAITNLLNRCGFGCSSWGSGKDALNCFNKKPDNFQGAIVDLSMPEMDGEEVIRRLREVAPDMPVILTTGNPIDPRIANCERLGIKSCLRKPYRLTKLQEVLHSAFHS